MTIEKLISDALWQIDYHEKRVQEEKMKLHVYYTARDVDADNPFKNPEPAIFEKEFDDKLKSKLDELNIDIDFSK